MRRFLVSDLGNTMTAQVNVYNVMGFGLQANWDSPVIHLIALGVVTCIGWLGATK